VYVQKISISHLRSFREAEVEFCHPGSEGAEVPNVTLLLGDNGAGKTSILRAIALTALAPVIGQSGFRPYKLLRRTRDESPEQAVLRGEFVLHSQDLGTKDRKQSRSVSTEATIVRRGDVEQVTTRAEMDPLWEGMFQERSPAFLVVGYGASRRVETGTSFDAALRAKSRLIRYQRVSGLFEEGVTLTPLGAWLPEFRRANPGRHKQVINLINRLLPEGTTISDQVENGEYVYGHQGSSVPFAAMSDGYRAYIGWLADLLYHVCMGAPAGYKLEENRGIVLVDEIDLHLHPAWQREVVPQLAAALPNLQFVLTSHSPLVAGTLQSGNLRLIEADDSGASVVRRLHEHVHGLTADQILVSSYFGLKSPRAPAAVDAMRELAVQAQEGSDTAAWEFLRRLSDSTFTSAERESIRKTDPVPGREGLDGPPTMQPAPTAPGAPRSRAASGAARAAPAAPERSEKPASRSRVVAAITALVDSVASSRVKSGKAGGPRTASSKGSGAKKPAAKTPPGGSSSSRSASGAARSSSGSKSAGGSSTRGSAGGSSSSRSTSGGSRSSGGSKSTGGSSTRGSAGGSSSRGGGSGGASGGGKSGGSGGGKPGGTGGGSRGGGR
jgi:predicted ATP-binding protein involved in virulence